MYSYTDIIRMEANQKLLGKLREYIVMNPTARFCEALLKLGMVEPASGYDGIRYWRSCTQEDSNDTLRRVEYTEEKRMEKGWEDKKSDETHKPKEPSI